ncbi:MAG: sugar phosphate isomerase/epimerase [Lentisphaerae bacterium]|nr:sugar phosphate isomerase/epimerase [Lentisphaerota bacterium]
MTKPIVGAQLYSLREHCKTLPDIEKTLGRVRDIGYTTVQLSGLGPADPGAIAKAAAAADLRIVATHVSWEQCRNGLDALIAEHKTWNCVHAAIGGLPGDYRSADGLKRFIDELPPVAEGFRAAGIDFSYHNHNHELVRIGARTWLQALYEDTAPELLKAELDTYWIQAGGGDPAAWIRACAGREPLLHCKDMCITPEREQRFAEVGEGNLNWPAILQAAEAGGVAYLLVEQDNCYERDPFDSMRISYDNLKGMGYA